MRKGNGFIEELEMKGIGIGREMDHAEYLVQLRLLQNEVNKEFLYSKGSRVSKSIKKIIELSEKKGVRNYPTIKRAVSSLEKLNKELCISQAGANAEKRVFKAIKKTYLDDFSIFQNIYISNENGETELDDVVITRNGILILEVKGTKSNIVITEQGKIMHEGYEPHDDKVLGEQMNNKRFLLANYINEELSKRKSNLKLAIDSFVVFDTPSNNTITVKDDYKAEKYCFTSKVPFIIENYTNDDKTIYTIEQLNMLNEILNDLSGKRKVFETELDFEKVKLDFANAIDLLNGKKDSKVMLMIKKFKNFFYYIKQYNHDINFVR